MPRERHVNATSRWTAWDEQALDGATASAATPAASCASSGSSSRRSASLDATALQHAAQLAVSLTSRRAAASNCGT
jgi:hypothetical protein